MSAQPLKVLALDIEGGHGGSSRSLFNTIRHLDFNEVAVEVWCKREGAVRQAYEDLGVTCRITPGMPKVSALPRFSRNAYVHLAFMREFMAARGFRAELAEASKDFDVLHFNHEALAWLGSWLRPRTEAALVFHNRTMLWRSVFARMQIRAMDRAADRLVFITENERDNVRRLGAKTAGDVVYNPVQIFTDAPRPHEALAREGRFKVCCLSNYAWNRGVDRLVEVAEALKSMGREDVVFAVAGDMALSSSLPGDLGETARRGGDLGDYALDRGVGDMFLFLGHVPDPERVLSACDVLVKPTRESNPWGRDILEAMAMAKPVISCGTYNAFVINSETGYLLKEYKAAEFADRITELADDPKRVGAMGAKAREIVREKCHGPDKAAELTRIWKSAVNGRKN